MVLSLDYQVTFPLVAKKVSIQVHLSLAVSAFYQLDMKNGFLHIT